ncbi:hypothetical protein [Streptomyces sp. SID11385]|uniref:hypothetical protein n=1 Tax=Streptomyces sp. SID11385 TaxID=2706031 RepID=UPI0013C8B1DC|nr:hypothetical protein [Streptomyces sp. SID11385]NEA38258.1 hypothetical protein [Streptomyces sp. SID11385]
MAQTSRPVTPPRPDAARVTASPAALPPRPAAVVNAEIRALWCAGGRLAEERRGEYEALLAEWSAALRAEVVTAA